MDILRDAVGSEPAGAMILLGSASLVSGSRPDVENLYPNAPLNYRAGWGFMVLTNMLPDLVNGRATGGNGAFRLHAYAVDTEGRSSYLGAKSFQANNSASSKPFGTLDTPAQGGTASGAAYMVWGWAISPRATIPTNGSTITMFVDGVARGNPIYNINRSDIAGMFPGYANSNGAIGYIPLDTTTLANGTHTISWVVTDNPGNTEGIGSRFFTVQNGIRGADLGRTVDELVDGGGVERRRARPDGGDGRGSTAGLLARRGQEGRLRRPRRRSSSSRNGPARFDVRTRETEQVEVKLASQFDDGKATYEGYVVIDGRMRPLPVGCVAQHDAPASSRGSQGPDSSAATSSCSSARRERPQDAHPGARPHRAAHDSDDRR